MDNKFIITEGVMGYYHYHISDKDKFIISLCGAQTMQTSISSDSWGQKSHLNERWCNKCWERACRNGSPSVKG